MNTATEFTQMHRDFARWTLRQERRCGTKIDDALAALYRARAEQAVLQAKRMALPNPERTALFELAVAELIEAELKEAAA